MPTTTTMIPSTLSGETSASTKVEIKTSSGVTNTKSTYPTNKTRNDHAGIEQVNMQSIFNK